MIKTSFQTATAHAFRTSKTYVIDHKKQFITGGSVVLAIVIIVLALALYSYNTRQPKVIYEPATACVLLTPAEAKTLLGNATINGVSTPPVQSGTTATSQCSYSDGKADTANAVVAAINVRSGIDDTGIKLNKLQFESGKPKDNVQDVPNVADSAYFNEILGQLNVLKGSTWVVMSYGSGASPETNTLDDAIKLSKLVLN